MKSSKFRSFQPDHSQIMLKAMLVEVPVAVNKCFGFLSCYQLCFFLPGNTVENVRMGMERISAPPAPDRSHPGPTLHLGVCETRDDMLLILSRYPPGKVFDSLLPSNETCQPCKLGWPSSFLHPILSRLYPNLLLLPPPPLFSSFKGCNASVTACWLIFVVKMVKK